MPLGLRCWRCSNIGTGCTTSLARITIKEYLMQGQPILGLAVMLCVWLVGSVGGVQGADTDPFESMQLERLPRAVALPGVSLPDLEGQQVSLRSLQGQVVLMNFWTTW